GARRARGLLFPRHAPAARSLPDAPARAGARAPRRALQRTRRRGDRARRPRARGAQPDGHARRRLPRAGAARIARHGEARARMRRYVRDVATLARKDLLLELRARDTLPAMLLFVVSALVVFHFALPQASSNRAAYGLLWVALIFTALLGLVRAFAAERDQGLLDALVLAPCDRSAIWLAKALAMLAFLALAEVVALPAFAIFFSGVSGMTVAGVVLADLGICAVGTLLAAMAAVSRARELLLPL